VSGKQLQFVNLGKDSIASLTDCEDLRQVTTVPGYFALDKDRVQLVDQPVFFQTGLRTQDRVRLASEAGPRDKDMRSAPSQDSAHLVAWPSFAG
jgi:hypothetical protein